MDFVNVDIGYLPETITSTKIVIIIIIRICRGLSEHMKHMLGEEHHFVMLSLQVTKTQ